MRVFNLVPLFAQTVILVGAPVPGVDTLSLARFDRFIKGSLPTPMGVISFQETGKPMMDDQFTLLVDNTPTDLKGWILSVPGFGVLGGKSFLVVRQALNRGASNSEETFFLLVKEESGEINIVSLKNPDGADIDTNAAISLKGKRLILSSKVNGTVTYDGTEVQFTPHVFPTTPFDLRQIKGNSIGWFWVDPRFVAILGKAIEDPVLDYLKYNLVVTSGFVSTDGFYCISGFPQHMGGGDDNAILAISATGTRVQYAYLKGGKELHYGGFDKLAELCPWMKRELAELVETYRRNTGDYPECGLAFPGSNSYYAQLPKPQFEHQVTLAAIRAKEGKAKDSSWKYKISNSTISRDIPRETQKYQTWAMNDLRPIYVEFVTLAEAYSRRFGGVALKDLLIKSNTQSLIN